MSIEVLKHVDELWPEAGYTDAELALIARAASGIGTDQAKYALDQLKLERKSRKVEVAWIAERFSQVRRQFDRKPGTSDSPEVYHARAAAMRLDANAANWPAWMVVRYQIACEVTAATMENPSFAPDRRTWAWAAQRLRDAGGMGDAESKKEAASMFGLDLGECLRWWESYGVNRKEANK